MKFSAWVKNKEELEKSASGGIAFALGKYIIDNGGQVAGVIMREMRPKWIVTDNIEELKKTRNSVYLWANPLPIYQKIASTPSRKTLFVGLPCQVAGLKRYMRLKDIADKNVTYISLRCHGVIRNKTFYDYIKWVSNIVKEPVTSVKFREEWKKGAGLSINFANHQIDFFKPKLIKDYIKKRNVTKMCKTCTYNRNASDITLGDYWGCPLVYKNRYGTSIVETNTTKGHKLFTSLSNIEKKQVKDTIPVDKNKIGLLKVADFRNFGNLMLSSNFITYMKDINKNAEFVFIENESAQDAIEKATGVTDIEYRHIETLNRWSFKKVLFDTFIGLVNPQEMEQVRVFADCKHVAVLGGDHFSGGIHYATWIINLIRLNALAKCGKRVHIVSNTVGKFPWFLKPFVKHVFNNLETIWCRDMDSMKRCSDINVYKNVYYVPDLAFLPLHNELENEVKAIKDGYCTIVTTALWKQYANTYKEYISGVKHMAQALIILTHKNVMILPHSTYEGDLQIARDVADNDSIFALIGEEPMTPSKARAVLANSYLNVSFRMHSAISSLTTNIPVVAIAYSPKYKGVIAEGYELSELVVEKMGRRNWKKCVEKTIETIKYVLEHYTMISLQIKEVNTDRITYSKDSTLPLFNILEEA